MICAKLFTLLISNANHSQRRKIFLIIQTELASKRFSFESALRSFLNLFCNCKEDVDFRNAGGGGIKRGLFGKGNDTLVPPKKTNIKKNFKLQVLHHLFLH